MQELAERDEIEEKHDKILARLSDLAVVRRGEHAIPFLTGKVDGEPVMAERLTVQEYADYRTGRLGLIDLAMHKFDTYLGNVGNEHLRMAR